MILVICGYYINNNIHLITYLLQYTCTPQYVLSIELLYPDIQYHFNNEITQRKLILCFKLVELLNN